MSTGMMKKYTNFIASLNDKRTNQQYYTICNNNWHTERQESECSTCSTFQSRYFLNFLKKRTPNISEHVWVIVAQAMLA